MHFIKLAAIAAFAFAPVSAFAASANSNAGGAVTGQDRAIMVQDRNIVRQQAKLDAFKTAHPDNVDAATARQAGIDARKARLDARKAGGTTGVITP